MATQTFPPHMQRLLEMARAYDERHKVAITDVTPDGYGPTESAASYSTAAPHLTAEQSRLRRSISEAQTILKGRMPQEKRAAIQRSLRRAQEQLNAATPQRELDRQMVVRLGTDSE